MARNCPFQVLLGKLRTRRASPILYRHCWIGGRNRQTTSGTDKTQVDRSRILHVRMRRDVMGRTNFVTFDRLPEEFNRDTVKVPNSAAHSAHLAVIRTWHSNQTSAEDGQSRARTVARSWNTTRRPIIERQNQSAAGGRHFEKPEPAGSALATKMSIAHPGSPR
jgi:hypothetical protein